VSTLRPITLLTGFLGAGKTTLVNRLLADARHAQTAVIVNELSGTGIDRSLIAAVKGQVIEMTTGCLCCAAGGDVGHALLDLARRAEHYEINPFARVIIETTGLADPAPLVPQLMLDARIAAHYRLTSIVTAVDAVQGESQLERYVEARSQVKLADLVALTKSDLALDPVSKRDVAKLIDRLATLNPAAEVVDVHDAATDLVALFERQPLSRRDGAAAGWLGLPRTLGGAGKSIAVRHTAGVAAHTVEIAPGVSERALLAAVEGLLRTASPRILRIKGLVATAELPERPLVLHAVGRYLSAPVRLDRWPDGGERAALVVITDGLDEAAVSQAFASLNTEAAA
jgi:G3E family GTPase